MIPMVGQMGQYSPGAGVRPLAALITDVQDDDPSAEPTVTVYLFPSSAGSSWAGYRAGVRVAQHPRPDAWSPLPAPEPAADLAVATLLTAPEPRPLTISISIGGDPPR